VGRMWEDVKVRRYFLKGEWSGSVENGKSASRTDSDGLEWPADMIGSSDDELD